MSDDDLDINEIDLDAEMDQLAGADMHQLAQQALGGKSKPKSAIDKNELQLTLGEIVRPIAHEVEAIKKAAHDNSLLLVALGKVINGQTAQATQATQAASPTAALDTIAQQMQRLGSVESANQKLFDALHAELKGYKDNFLFEALQKPFIRELFPLFDDLSSLHAQLEKRLDLLRTAEKQAAAPAAAPTRGEDPGEAEFLRNLAGNVENHVHHLVEVLLRMDVELTQTVRGLPLDKKVHRTVSFEPAPTPEDDNTVARSIKPGFFWKERIIRPEDVIVYRWRPPASASSPPPAGSAPAPVVSPSLPPS